MIGHMGAKFIFNSSEAAQPPLAWGAAQKILRAAKRAEKCFRPSQGSGSMLPPENFVSQIG